MSAQEWLAQNPQPLASTANSESVEAPDGGQTEDPVKISNSSSILLSPAKVETGIAVNSDAMPSTTDSAAHTSVTLSAVLPTSLPTPRSILANTNNPLAGPVRAQFASSPGYVVPAPSFSYSVFPRSNPSAGSQLSQSSSAFKLTPPVPAAALQPPVPGQLLGSRPFFYNVVPNANVASATGQQFQLTTSSSQGHFHGGKFTPASALSLQPPVPRQPLRPNAFIPGTAVPNAPAPLPAASSIQKGYAAGATNYSLVGCSLPPRVETSQKDLSLQKATSDSLENASASAGSVSSQHAQSSSNPSSSSTSLALSSNSSSSNILAPVAPSFTAQPAIAGTPGAHGISNSAMVSNTASLTSSTSTTPISSSFSIAASSTSLLSTSTTAPVMLHTPGPPLVSHQTYLHYPLQTTAVQLPLPFWSSPQAGNVQCTPVTPHLGVISAPYPFPIHGMPLPAVPMSNVQPPGVSTVVTDEKLPANVTGSSHAESNLSAESLSTVIDQDKKVNDPHNDETDTNNEHIETWTSHKTESGAVYYYNSVTGESTYQRPPNFKGELPQVTGQTTPVSWEKIVGTEWTLVTTNDGKKYYYDSKNKISSWSVPAEVLDLRKNQDPDVMTESTSNLQSANAQAESASTVLSTPAVHTGGRESLTPRSSSIPGTSSALDLIKKKLHEAGSPVTSSPLSTSGPDTNASRAVEPVIKGQQVASNKDKSKDPNSEGNISDSSSDSEDEESVPSKEGCIIQFKEMLKEHGIAPFSKWDKELPKIVFDPRFKAVPSHSARRTLFEHYVRTRAEEERKEKRAAQKAAIDSFKQLLDEASEDIDHKTDYYTFKRKWASDSRFEALDRKDRELLFNERVKAAEEKIRESRMITATNFKSMLRENHEIMKSSRWSRVKDNFRKDLRYKAVKHEDRETLFNEYISELKAAEDQAVKVAKARNDEQEKLKERERETRKRKEREEQELERVKLKVRRKEAEYGFRALLVETIKDPKVVVYFSCNLIFSPLTFEFTKYFGNMHGSFLMESLEKLIVISIPCARLFMERPNFPLASWKESKPKLEKDPLGRATSQDLTQEDAEKLFREHVKDLCERRANDYRALLAEVITQETAAATKDGKTILNSWSEAKQILKPDLRYTKLPSKDRETLWRRYTEDMIRKQKLASEHKSDTDGNGKSRALANDLPKKSPRRSHGQR